jgi:hypothetical protein
VKEGQGERKDEEVPFPLSVCCMRLDPRTRPPNKRNETVDSGRRRRGRNPCKISMQNRNGLSRLTKDGARTRKAWSEINKKTPASGACGPGNLRQAAVPAATCAMQAVGNGRIRGQAPRGNMPKWRGVVPPSSAIDCTTAAGTLRNPGASPHLMTCLGQSVHRFALNTV